MTTASATRAEVHQAGAPPRLFDGRDRRAARALARPERPSTCRCGRRAEAHVGELEARIAEMQAIARRCANSSISAHGDDRPELPILDEPGAGRRVLNLSRDGAGGALGPPRCPCLRRRAMTRPHERRLVPERNWLAEIRPAMREVAPGIVEVFDYGRGRQGLIPALGSARAICRRRLRRRTAELSLDRGETFYTAQGGIPDLRQSDRRLHDPRLWRGAQRGHALAEAVLRHHRRHACDRDRDPNSYHGSRRRGADPLAAWPNFVGAVESAGARAVVAARRGRALEP